ncbi:hypothetical protein B566_EDAN014891 [Ephemera danica]|nr:hypothetical protein B566_EDAN014891 [Ephemera danica]
MLVFEHNEHLGQTLDTVDLQSGLGRLIQPVPGLVQRSLVSIVQEPFETDFWLHLAILSHVALNSLLNFPFLDNLFWVSNSIFFQFCYLLCMCGLKMMLSWFGIVTALVIALCRISQQAKYAVKWIVFTVCSVISATVFVPFMLHRPKDSRNGLNGAYLAPHTQGLHGDETRGSLDLPLWSCVLALGHRIHRQAGSGQSAERQFLPAIPTEGLGKDDLAGVIERTRNEMQEAFTRLSAETARK